MNTRIFGPLPVILAATLLGTAAGLGWCWYRISGTVAQTLAVRRQLADEQRAKVEERRAHGWDFWTIEMENLASELKGEKARCLRREDELDKRSARLAAEKQELDRVRTDIEAMRREIDDRVIAIRADEAKNLRSLAQTYSNLTPRAAVAILKEMDDSTVVKILSLMKPDVVGPIFEEMSRSVSSDGTLARRAATLSEKLRLMKSGQLPAGA